MLPFTYAVRNLFRDPSRLLQTVGGSALVVLLLTAAVAFNEGMDRVLSASGSPKNVMLVGKGSEESIERSEVPLAAESAAKTSIPGLASQLNTPAVSGEIIFQAPITPPSGESKQGQMRGVLPVALLVHPEVVLLEGHFPGPGEVMVGKLAPRKLGLAEEALALGEMLVIGEQEFRISGRFAAPGTVLESEFWLDRNDLATLMQRDSLSAVYVRLSDGEPEDVEVFAFQRNDLELSSIREDIYYDKLSRFYGPIKGMTWLTAALVAAGALFGGINTLYAAFASRIREMATLQAIGYTRGALLVSLIQESLLATLTGTLLAMVAALLLLEGRTIAFSMGAFELSLSPAVVLTGLVTGALLGTVGTLPPAIRTLAPALPKALRSN
ncbi:MAG: ABC transporter permease [Verrucomicrobiota bacterium JB023]|nr:ABC transporter permease [Verrucomicrobiota bacterium JB023]